MKVQVQLINERGRPLPSKARAKMPTYRGILRVNEERVQELGRAVVIAELVSETEASANPLLPTLHDASMLYVKGSQIRVRGFEFVEGAQYGQTWDIKVL
jgi:hypothetical protein